MRLKSKRKIFQFFRNRHHLIFVIYHLIIFSGCESETDTEEFEKVDQSPNDRAKDGKIESNSMGKVESNEIATSTCRIETTNIETLTEVRTMMTKMTLTSKIIRIGRIT